MHQPIYIANVHDATGHLEKGLTKNVDYIVEICRKSLETIDNAEENVDLILFDGAKVVQTAGECLSALYPRMSVVHGAEHVCSLFCANLLKNTELKELVNIYRTLYRYFGSGSVHMTYAIFQKHASRDNNGKNIGLIQAAGTRMGGYFYAFYRLLKLKRSLKNTINSLEWTSVKIHKKPKKKLNLKQLLIMIIFLI